MARAVVQGVQVMDQPVRKSAKDKSGARHFGPYGVSFNGQNPGGTEARGLTFERRWTRLGVHPYDEIRWETRTAAIGNESGKLVFEQKDVEVPEFWSQLATNVVVSKYFRGHLNTPDRETSVRQLIDRVVNTIAAWAETQRYFATDEDLRAFQAELTHLLVHQKMSFNSPVWFNVGIEQRPQCSACFINSVQDSMSSIMDLAKTEAMLFKFGSGAGSNLSPIRSAREKMSGGGTASGPVSFMKGYDAFAGVVKSGGKTRRAAKMVILDADHPDVLDFIDSKMLEEKKAWALIEMGYDPSFTGEAYGSVSFQNANHSVRVTDDFMKAVVDDKDWTTHAVVDGAPMGTYKARDIFRRMADAAHLCGDPGIQYDSTINDWHTSANSDRIYASNPCVTGDTLVATDLGWRRIDSLVGSKANIIGLDGQPHPVDRIFPTGTKPVFELRTRSGYRVRITADHKVATTRGDVAAKDLRPEDRIFLNAPGFGQDSLPVELGEAIGLAVGDGYLSHQTIDGREFAANVLTMHADEAGVLEAVAAELNAQKRLLKVAGSSGRNDNVNVTVKSTGSRLAFASRPVVDLFLRYAVLDEGADLKRFTDDAFGLDRAGMAAILRGLFSADGTVANNGTKNQYVALDSTSLELVVQVQRMLLGFGIKARIYEGRRGGKLSSLLPDGKGGMREYPVKEMHSLRISRASRVRFEREIGFAPESPKAAALARLNAAVSTYSDELIDEVASVTPLGSEAVFDLTEAATSHFVANGLVVHNCSEYMFLNDTACFAPETRISTPDGLRTVEQLYLAQARGEPVFVTTDLHGEQDHRRMTAHRAAMVTLVGDRQVYRMTLADGRSIRATGDHRFLTDNGEWKRVDQLAPDVDRVAIRESGNAVRFESSATDVRRWQMLGWMSADGVFSGDVAALAFGPTEQAIAQTMTEELNLLLTEALDGEDTVEDIERGLLGTTGSAAATANGADDSATTAVSTGRRANVSVHSSGTIEVSTRSGALVRMLEDRYGLRAAAAGGRRDVPSEVQRIPEDLKVAYLQGLFSADATIRTAGGAAGPEITLASTAPELVRSVQLLLADLGIASTVAWTGPEGTSGAAAHLHVYGEAARKFAALVGTPLSPDEQAKVDVLMAHPFARGLANARATTVRSIVADGVETVYDVTEPVTHSLVAEGLIAHNCNLASLNLMKFVRDDGEFDVESYRYAAKLTITAQEILVDNASYPTPRIEENSHRFRPLGLGYANLGALLMSRGLAYDSDEGRDYAAALTAIMHGEAYRQSSVIARDHGGPFNDYQINREPFLRVIRKHRDAAYKIPADQAIPADMLAAARVVYDEALELGEANGYRNAQVTVLAPTGTIAFMMDCDTTGIEPDIALIKYKKLVGEGFLKIVNQTVPAALKKLGYAPDQVEEILAYINERETIEGAPHVKPEHLAVFDCAFKPVNGERSIHYMGHVRMMSAVQPFLSGAISKTVNMPEAATAEEIEEVYLEGWKLGLKAIAIYRDGSKRSQPLSTGKKKDDDTADAGVVAELRTQLAIAQAEAKKPHRHRLPAERTAVTHKFDVAGHEGYITVGLYPDGQPGEIFLKMAKEGSTVSGLMDTFATSVSLALQYGVPLRDLVNKFAHVRFEPSGFTGNQEIPIAKSIVDYIFRWMGSRFLPAGERAQIGLIDRGAVVDSPAPFAFGGGFGGGSSPSSTAPIAPIAPIAEEGPSAIDGAIAPPAESTKASEPPADAPKATAVAAAPKADLPVVATNGQTDPHANGNGNGNGGNGGNGHALSAIAASLGTTKVSFTVQEDAPSCAECGSIMIRNGSCYKCLNCGSTSGCS